MGSVTMLFLNALLLLLYSCVANAHTLTSESSESNSIQQNLPQIWAWDFAPWVIFLMLLSAGLYGVGLWRLWRTAGVGHGLQKQSVSAFMFGWLALVVALVSPLDTMGSWLFSAHMLQHEILMIVAAPLLVSGKPLSIWIWAFPVSWRRYLASVINTGLVKKPWHLITSQLGAWTLHAIALWCWHIPYLFDAALHNNTIHTWQHISFLASALLFWWSVLSEDAKNNPKGWALLSIFSTMMHTAALGVLLTLAYQPWYTAYDRTNLFGLSALEDQQLGGLIMWVPAGLVYLIAGLWIISLKLMKEPKPMMGLTWRLPK